MIKIENVAVYNFMSAVRGMRNPFESWDKIDSHYIINRFSQEEFILGENDYKLAVKLSKAGNDHGKFLRQILVSIDLTAPEYFFKEFDTYKVGTVANSTSMMHLLGNRKLTVDDFSFDEPDSSYVYDYLELINEIRDHWIDSGKKKPSPKWRLMNQLMAISFLYTRTITLNYQVLKNMYHSRKSHKLTEWHEFCSWIESLDYSELITLKEPK